MSNEVKQENKGSVMNAMLKSTVGKLAILAGAAATMSSCTTTTYSNSTGYWERVQSTGVSAGQVLSGTAIIGGIITDNNAINKGGQIYNGVHGGGGYIGSHGSTGRTIHCHGQVYHNVR